MKSQDRSNRRLLSCILTLLMVATMAWPIASAFADGEGSDGAATEQTTTPAPEPAPASEPEATPVPEPESTPTPEPTPEPEAGSGTSNSATTGAEGSEGAIGGETAVPVEAATPEAALEAEAESISTLSIEPLATEYTVHFWIGPSLSNEYILNDGSGVVNKAPQTVAEGEAVVEPNPPSISGKISFRGWSVYDPEVYPESFYTRDMFWAFAGTQNPDLVTADTDLYAVFSDKLLISFKDSDGKVVQTREVEQGETFAGPSAEVTADVEANPPADGSANQRLMYWYLEGDSNHQQIVFGATVATRDMILVPYWSDAQLVIFDSRGGNYVAPQYPSYGDVAVEPATPVRDGFIFAFWSENEAASPADTAKAFDFSTVIQQDTNLYAIWSPKDVGYSVAYWFEKENITGDPGNNQSNYAFYKSAEINSANANFNALKLPAGSIVGTDVSLDATQLALLDSIVAFPAYSEYYFQTSLALKGDGSSVVNIYFKRKVYTIYIDVQGSSSSVGNTDASTKDINPQGGSTTPGYGNTYRRENAYLIHNGVTYQGTSNSSNMYSFEAKYGQNLSGIWPSYGEVESGASNIKIYGWYLGNYAATPHSDRLEMNSSLCDAAEAVGGAGDTSSTLYCAPQWRTTSAALVDHTRLYYVQVPAGTAPAVVVALDNASAWTLSSSPSDWPAYISYDGVTYQLYQGENGCQSSNTSAQSITIPGFTLQVLYGAKKAAARPTDNAFSYLHIGKNSAGVNHFTYSTSETGHSSSNDVYQYIIFLYSRNSFTLSFNVQNPLSTPIASSTVASGTALASYEPADPSYTGYVFGGWYTTPACLTGQEFDFTSGVMPAGNLTLYAKWTPAAVSVKFYDSIHGT
ncbi:MAG: InlB B-repeat-containing protein, partial [Coriobacteriales bacterium]|nr:InlB B-repeat-containing protein [Coriobacteriales bacterium]